MKTCLFVSRHAPTHEQNKLAKDLGYCLEHVGDTDAFAPDKELLAMLSAADCVSMVHPALMGRVIYGGWPRSGPTVLVWKNSSRMPEGGGKPVFTLEGVAVIEQCMGDSCFGLQTSYIPANWKDKVRECSDSGTAIPSEFSLLNEINHFGLCLEDTYDNGQGITREWYSIGARRVPKRYTQEEGY